MASPMQVRRLSRSPSDKVVAGVAAGLAAHLGVPVLLIRAAFVVLALFNGLGAIMYAAFWAVLSRPARTRDGRNLLQLLSFLALGLGFLVLQISAWGSSSTHVAVGWLAAIVLLGAGIIWHQADPERRQRWSAAVPQMPWLGAILDNDRRAYLVRFIGGGLLVVVGMIGAVVAGGVSLSGATLSAVLYGLLFAVVALAGVGVVLAPLLYRMYSALRTEQEARIREQERAELAAMIHDQVLHTLALIQRNSGDTKSVLRLARGQERSLRNWLYKSSASPTERFGAALEQISAEVEDTYAVAVETVVVGDLEVSEPVAALVAAAREALVNAGRHAKVATVSLYAEVEPGQVSVFVRDRGVGFILSTVDEDRHGVRGSIVGRMQRHGGRAEIRSEPGDGTEVRLTMPVHVESPRARR